MGEYVEYWMPIYKAGVKASTYNAYISILNTAVAPISGVRISKITVDDIAKAVCWLAGDDSAYVTGQVISVNGGMIG